MDHGSVLLHLLVEFVTHEAREIDMVLFDPTVLVLADRDVSSLHTRNV